MTTSETTIQNGNSINGSKYSKRKRKNNSNKTDDRVSLLVLCWIPDAKQHADAGGLAWSTHVPSWQCIDIHQRTETLFSQTEDVITHLAHFPQRDRLHAVKTFASVPVMDGPANQTHKHTYICTNTWTDPFHHICTKTHTKADSNTHIHTHTKKGQVPMDKRRLLTTLQIFFLIRGRRDRRCLLQTSPKVPTLLTGYPQGQLGRCYCRSSSAHPDERRITCPICDTLCNGLDGKMRERKGK